MKQKSTQDLLLLHAYGETTLGEKEQLAKEFIQNPSLQDELMGIIRTKRQLNAIVKSPSETSVRIIMEHSYKTEHLQEI